MLELGQRRHPLSEKAAAFRHGTWLDLFRTISDGSYSSEYALGETIPLSLSNGETCQMQIVAFDKDTDYDRSEIVPVTLLSIDLLAQQRRFNPAYVEGIIGTGVAGGWPACELRAWMQDTLWQMIPEDVAGRIHTVKKYSFIKNPDESAANNVVSADRLWIPSLREMWNSLETMGPSYAALFKTAEERLKKRRNETNGLTYSLRSASDKMSQHYRITYNGGLIAGTASNPAGVCFGFCVGN